MEIPAKNYHEMCPKEAIRKVRQLDGILLCNEKRERVIHPESGSNSDLAIFMEDGKFQFKFLMPFVVVVLNNLIDRVEAMEKRLDLGS